MVGKVFLGQGDGLHRDDPLSAGELDNVVNESEPHLSPYSQSYMETLPNFSGIASLSPPETKKVCLSSSTANG